MSWQITIFLNIMEVRYSANNELRISYSGEIKNSRVWWIQQKFNQGYNTDII